MEDSSGVHSEENRVSPEKNTKRILKTPAQIMALEKFYNEHTYPTEEMKSELAEQIGLTEKQISSWFCHRRLKDKKLLKDDTCANGRQDRSSAIVQDRGSGLRQDSCGSTKQCDYRKIDLKEVESQRLYGHNLPAAEITYDRTSRYTGNVDGVDDTSSESSSSLQDKLFSHSGDPHELKSSGYVSQNGASIPLIPKSSNSMGYKPSGYLKVKGEIENAAITAVKRQLGKHYREDGPPLGVEFQPLPPGAFSSSNREPVNAGAFYVGDLARNHSLDVSEVRKHSNISSRHELYSSKMTSQDSFPNFSLKNACDPHDKKSHQQLKRKSASFNHSNSNTGVKSALDKIDDLAIETSINRNYKISSKHGVGTRTDTALNHHLPDGGKVISEQIDPWLHDSRDTSPKIIKRTGYMSKPSNLIPGSSKSPDVEERPSSRTTMEKLHGDLKGIEEYEDQVRVRIQPAKDMTVPKRFRAEFSQQEYMTKPSFPSVTRKINLTKGSAIERPSSFSEDETAETSSSVD